MHFSSAFHVCFELSRIIRNYYYAGDLSDHHARGEYSDTMLEMSVKLAGHAAQVLDWRLHDAWADNFSVVTVKKFVECFIAHDNRHALHPPFKIAT